MPPGCGRHLVISSGCLSDRGLQLCSNIQLVIGPAILGSPKLEDYHDYDPSPEPFWEGYEGCDDRSNAGAHFHPVR